MNKRMNKSSVSRFKDCMVREVRVNYLPTATKSFKINGPEDVAAFVRTVMVDNSREQFVALYLDGSHQVASYSIISIGSANQASVHPREVFQRAILVGATAITIAHNHPSGDLTTSHADRELTMRMMAAGELLKIALLDHVIVTDNSQLSLREMSELW